MPKVRIESCEILPTSGDSLYFINSEDSSFIQSESQKNRFFKLSTTKKKVFPLFDNENVKYIIYLPNVNYSKIEDLRVLGSDLAQLFIQEKTSLLLLEELSNEVVNWATDKKIDSSQLISSVLEGIALASYEFQKYKSKPTNQSIDIWVKGFKNEITELNHLTKAVCQARDWVNEPVIELTALKYGEEIITFFQETEVKVDVLTIEELKKHEMGGLLAINKGAPNEPLFIICEYKPYGVTEAPIVLVGKGVMFDTGGISLKETPNSMDIMKCDMGGSAAVLATLYAVAQNKLPIHVIVLVPATENRPDGNAIVPSDIITMYGGKKVEVLNTDAEGRVILGDALEWAKQYSPKLVIDLATLTGSAMGTLGYQGAIMMGTADESTKKQLIESSFLVYERLVELPIWEEYEKEIESDIADIKNLGSGYAGAITAGAFLKAFTDYPWIHVDIAGPAFLKQQDAYRTKGGTGMGVRLLYDFLKKTSK